jgi:glycosyltransferase involved in cell wall biosynthesis
MERDNWVTRVVGARELRPSLVRHTGLLQLKARRVGSGLDVVDDTVVSVLILTLNEEINIAECIDSCAWSDDIVVFDSFSSDKTREIALQKGARVVERRFDNYAAQRNAALTAVRYRHPWVLMIDADERVPPDLVAEIKAAVATASVRQVMFRMRRKDFFFGRWLKRSSGYPTWFGRLLRLGHVHFEKDFNEETIANGDVGHLNEHLVHFPFNKGVNFWLERHNRYSTMEAVAKSATQSEPFHPSDLYTRDPLTRRRALKLLAHRLPFRPLMVFLYLYIVRLGFLDGRAGFYFSRMRAIYEFFIDVKVMETKRRKRGLAV